MYCNDVGLGSHRGLGQTVTAYIAPTGGSAGLTMADLCRDTMFRILHPAECAAPAPQIAPVYVPPIEEAGPPPEPKVIYVEPPPPTMSPYPAEDEEVVDPILYVEQPIVDPTVITVGGGGWGPDSPAASVVVGPTEVFVEAAEETEGPGFGIVEVAIAAGLAWVLSQSYRKSRR